MQLPTLTAAILGFALVAGYAGLAWLRRGRDPSVRDDESILLAAPPPGMTAATATIVAGGHTRSAFLAALLDLASRDEIAFQQEGGAGSPAGVGIAIHGGETDDARVILNRRQPIGGGEAWLLMQLRTAAMHEAGGVPGDINLADRIGDSLAGLVRAGAFSLGDTDSAEARSARRTGLTTAPAPDLTAAADDLLARMDGGTIPADERAAAAATAGELMRTLSDPEEIARDPDRYLRQLETATGKPYTEEDRAQLGQAVARYQARHATAAEPEYIPAERARMLRAPLLFGPLVEAYAARHGWVVGLPVWQRLKWRIIAGIEVIAAPFALLVAGSVAAAFELDSGIAIGFTAGWLAGAGATFLMAPAMTARTPAGARVMAQLAAYRRTLKMTFGQARTMDEAVASNRLAWIETPDQALVWGVALGLRSDVEAVLARTSDLLQQGQASAAAFVPAWYSSASAGDTAGAAGLRATPPASVAEAGPMFSAIQAIGSGAGFGRGLRLGARPGR